MKIPSQDDLDSYLLSSTHPLFLADTFLKTGINHNTHNGTATFIKCAGHHYICTNNHVIEQLKNAEVVEEIQRSAAMLIFGRLVVRLSDHWGSLFYTPTSPIGEPNVDISIAAIDPAWELLKLKGKTAIDLDEWQEPPWQDIRTCVTAGYLNEGKWIDGKLVKTNQLTLVAEMSSSPNSNSREFTLFSTLDQPHGHFFSGISGSPILAQTKDEEFYPIGIVQEAAPSSRKNAQQDGQFSSEKDIMVRAILLTRERFLHWLSLTPIG